MAKKDVYDGDLDASMDFAAAGPNSEPASGLAVQNYIKKKIGVGYTVENGTEHLFFADEVARDAYIADPTREDLIIDRIPLEALYHMTYNLESDIYNYLFVGNTGNIIRYTFQTENKSGSIIAEPVTVTYTIVRGGTKQVVTMNYGAGTNVAFNVDKYLLEGTNSITVAIRGQLSQVGVSFSVVYQVINLSLVDNMNIAQVYRPTSGDTTLQVPYSVSGVGQKIMEWYVDGVRVQFNRTEDEINDNTSSRTKYINIVGLEQGRHILQFRVGIVVSGETFYSETHYREFIISQSQPGNPILTTATELPSGTILGVADSVVITPEQFEAFVLRIGAFNPDGHAQNTVVAAVNGNNVASVVCNEGTESHVTLTLAETGEGVLSLTLGSYTREIDLDVQETELDLHEITTDLQMNFTADGKSNYSDDKDTWTDGVNHATLVGFDFTNTSGWVANRLVVPSGAHIDFDLAPLWVNPTANGKTIELEFRTVNVDNDNATLIDLINTITGAGIKLTATEIFVKSQGGLNLNRRYKTNEDLRISIVINKKQDSTFAKLVQVYFNGILSITQNFSESDQFTAPNLLSVGGTDAGIILKQIRIYNTALDSDSIVNNFTIYRPTTEEKLSVYERNNLYERDTARFDVDKIAGFLPVMIITGDLTPIETATDTKATTVVDIEYINLQAPAYSFKMYHAQMRPQGTSSLTYPRKNLRLYTTKRDDTVVYDANGNVVADRLYAFKPNAQRVSCWTLKADFAESSSTHNTGVARIWNDVLKQAQVNGEYVLRTNAQKTALDNGFPYDVRTTVDGFPIVIFHRLTEDDPLTFLGKYNFNNDKSSESVFGFKGIPGFDNTNVQCWEFRDSGFDLALFKTPTSGRTYAEEFDYYAADYKGRFMQVWESRYPDTDSPSYTHFRRLALWINSTEGADPTAEEGTPAKLAFDKWQSEKSQYFDLYKLASYYVYLMRFGAVDQTVKNSMITTEDGNHWFFILYDNDTILGVRNDGLLKFGPEIDRQSPDPELGGYAYAGHDSVLWNNFEADPECMELVRTIDSALFTAGLTYAKMIQMFNEYQAGKWAEKVYNKDAMYKYIEPYLYQDKNYLGSLQGSRSDHRKWWISNRFSLYDAIYANDSYNSNAITLLIPGASIGDSFTIVSGKDFYYGWGQNRQPMETGVLVEKGQSHEFVLSMNFEIGTPLRIYAPHYIETLNLSGLMEYIGSTNFNLAPAYSETLGSKMKTLILGVSNPATDVRRNTALTSPSGLGLIVTLENLNVAGFQALTTLDLETLVNLKTFKAKASGLTSVTFANGAPLTAIEYPSALQVLTLNSLAVLTTSGVVSENNFASVYKMDIRSCPNVSNSLAFIQNWMSHKSTADADCELYMDGVNWSDMAPADLIAIGGIGTLTLRGVCRITEPTDVQMNTLIGIFGASAFQEGAAFRIIAPDAVYISGPTSVLEGDSATYQAVVSSEYPGTLVFSIQSGSRPGTSIDSSTGVLTTTENGEDTANITIRATHTPTQGQVTYRDIVVTIEKAIYPTIAQVSIDGNADLRAGELSEYELAYSIQGVNGRMTALWTLTGDLASYATITSQSNSGCVISMPTEPSGNIIGTLSCALTKTSLGTSIGTVTKEIKFELKTRVTVNEVTNQSSHEDVANVQATVRYAETLANGVYILYTDGTLSAYGILVAGKTPVGPVLKTDNVLIVIYPSESTEKWSAGTVEWPGITTTTDQNVAKSDFAGASNTAAAIATGASAGTAFAWATGLGEGWYLPACGELNEIRLNVDNINIALGLIGGTAIRDGSYVASTQYNSVYYWKWSSADRFTNERKSNALPCRAVKTYSPLTSVQVPNGFYADVPRGSTITIDFPAVSGYATPAQQSLVTGGAAMTATGTYNTEVVTVQVTTETQGVTAEGQIITINGNTYTVGASGIVTAKVPYGANYTISANAKQGYNTPAEQSFTAGQVSRSVTMEYTEKLEGVFILYTDGTLSNYDTLDSGKTPVGVALLNDNVKIVIHPSRGSNTVWSDNNTTVISGVTTTTDRSAALLDFAGKTNTAAAIASGLAGSAFTWAAQAVYADGRTGYLPSAGEMMQIGLNDAHINTALNLIGGDTLNYGSAPNWTSTQGTADGGWNFYGGTTYPAGIVTKTTLRPCRSVASFE